MTDWLSLHGQPGDTMTNLLCDHSVHLCVDMQRMFAEQTEWSTPWAVKILPQIIALTEINPSNTIFTRFIPAANACKAPGMWQKYYERWENMTLEKIDPALLQLIPALKAFIPPATLFDKHVYGPWMETTLHRYLQQRRIHTLIVSGGETDICVLATLLGAVDLGYRVILARDALCSSNDATHDSIMNIYHNRFSRQIHVLTTEEILMKLLKR